MGERRKRMDVKKKLDRITQWLKEYVPQSVRGWLIFLGAMTAATMVCALLRKISTSDVHVPLIFVLAVLIVSLTTDGYLYGILAAFVSVITVNYAFTYPYGKMDFSVYGYPLTFLTMLAVGCAITALASRVKTQERVRRENDQEKLRANLLRAVSHDLRTPLTSISGSISAVLEGEYRLSHQQRRELLEDARKDADWLCRMVENLLSITRITGGKMNSITKKDEMLEEVLSEAVVNFRKRNPVVKVTVSVPDTLLFVPMDAMLIEQVLMNLMLNAAVHGRTTSLISITAEADKHFARVSVEDDGEGIPEKLLDNIFDEAGLFKAGKEGDNTRSMGIGLTVCKTIVEAHGGKISAKNNDWGGASFTFTLPMGGTGNEHQG